MLEAGLSQSLLLTDAHNFAKGAAVAAGSSHML